MNRPGRCWAEIELEPLGVEGANRWLAARDCDVRVSSAKPIADLCPSLPQ